VFHKEKQLEVIQDFFYNIIPWYGKTYTLHLLLINQIYSTLNMY